MSPAAGDLLPNHHERQAAGQQGVHEALRGRAPAAEGCSLLSRPALPPLGPQQPASAEAALPCCRAPPQKFKMREAAIAELGLQGDAAAVAPQAV